MNSRSDFPYTNGQPRKGQTTVGTSFVDKPGSVERKKRNGLTIRAHLGTCLICRSGCFDGDEITRGRGALLGLMHAACARGAEGHGDATEAPPEGSANHDAPSGPHSAAQEGER